MAETKMAIKNINAKIVIINGLLILPKRFVTINILIVLFAVNPLFFIIAMNITVHFAAVTKNADTHSSL